MTDAQTKAPLLGLESLKLLASFGIVLFHLGADLPPLWPALGYAGLPVFTMITAALAARSARATDFRTFRQRRLRRLLMPWLWWSACYGCCRGAIAAAAGKPIWAWVQPSMLGIGTYPHLWYLPYAALLTLAIGAWFARRGNPWTWTGLGLLALPVSEYLMSLDLPAPLPQWLFVTPAALFGLAVSHLPNDAAARSRLLALAGPLLAACGLLTVLTPSQLALPYSIGVTAVAAVWPLPQRTPVRLQRLCSTSFGIYVLHMGVFLLLSLFTPRLGLAASPLQALTATFVISMAITFVLQHSPLRTMV